MITFAWHNLDIFDGRVDIRHISQPVFTMPFMTNGNGELPEQPLLFKAEGLVQTSYLEMF